MLCHASHFKNLTLFTQLHLAPLGLMLCETASAPLLNPHAAPHPSPTSTLRGTSLRLMDTAQTPPRDSAACCAALLPMLLETGLPSSVPEVGAPGLRVWTCVCTCVSTCVCTCVCTCVSTCVCWQGVFGWCGGAASLAEEKVRGGGGVQVQPASVVHKSCPLHESCRSDKHDICPAPDNTRPLLRTQIRGLSLDVLTQAVRSAGPAPLAPLAPALVPGLLEALSGMEVGWGFFREGGGQPCLLDEPTRITALCMC